MRQLRALVFYVAVLGALIATNYFLYVHPPSTEPLVSTNAINIGAAVAVVPGQMLAVSELLLVHTQTRPLFSPTRRKWVEPVQPVPAAPPEQIEPPALPEPVFTETPPPSVTLIGIEKTPLGTKALLLKTGTIDAHWFKSGEKLEGWAVQAIDAGSVEMTLGERKIKLELYPPLPALGIER